MDRKVAISVFLGIFAAGFAIVFYGWIANMLFPFEVPEGSEKWTDEARYAFIIHLPPVHFIPIILANGLGILTGMVASRLFNSDVIVPLYAVLIIMTMMAILTFFSHPYPLWFLFADLGFTIALGLFYINGRKRN